MTNVLVYILLYHLIQWLHRCEQINHRAKTCYCPAALLVALISPHNWLQLDMHNWVRMIS